MLCIPVVATVGIKLMLSEVWGYIAGLFILIVTSVFVIVRLDKQMDLKAYFAKYKNRKSHDR